ncbi:MAG TPA: C25 family cysteine peptidase [Lentimicrobium sp.]|nr:C25 family cysteine peptidase [Lentimicrobium sp.]
MKQWLLILWSLFLSGTISAQGSQFYSIRNNGDITPTLSFTQEENAINVQLVIESFSSTEVQFNGNAEKITFPGGIGIMEKGLPDIQHLATSIAINPTGKPELIITNAEYTDYPSFNIAPSAGDPGLYPTGDLTTDTAVYNANTFWPENIAQMSDPYIIGTTRGISLHFYPVHYNPVTHTLRVYHHISVSVEYSDEQGINELTRYTSSANLPMEHLTDSHFINQQPSSPSGRYSMVNEENGRMLVIAHPDFIGTMEPFIMWKNQKGIQCEIVDVTSIGNEEQIREYVAEYYYNNGLTYLLLVGDEKFIPSNQANKGLSDIRYGYISGDDHYPEILVGRFPCTTAEDCRIMVERTINYEKNPSAKADFNNFLGIGSGSGPGDDGELDYEHIRKIATLLNPSIYPDYNELYDGSRGGNDLNGNPTAALTAEAINKGMGAIMYLGHGSINTWLTTGFSTTNAYKLENTETHPFIWSAGCNNGAFNDATCLAEGFLRASIDGKPSGAIAALMSSATQSWYPPMEAQDEIAILLADQDNKAPVTFGGISFSGCMKMNDKYGKGAYDITDNWILFGDPSVELRTATPLEFHPVYDSITGSDATVFSISSLPDNAVVTASNNGTILATTKAQNGHATLNTGDIKTLDSFTITITGKNYRPLLKEITITQFPSMAIGPLPADHSFKVATSTSFTWALTAGCNPESYTWEIRKTGADHWESVNFQNVSDFNPGKLEYLTSYEWRVITHNQNGNSTSKIFSFTTIEEPDEDFEEGNFPRSNWMNTESWYIDNTESYEGNFSLHSGSTVSRQSSSLYYECETLACDLISFWLKQNIQDQSSGIEFYMDDFLVAQWSNTINWTNFTYQIEPGYHKFEWKFTGSGDSSSVNSAAWIDNIYLPVNEPVSVSALSQSVCPVTSIQLQPEISNYASLKWETAGTGYFDDQYKIDAVYFPSDQDFRNGIITLDLTVVSNSVCEPGSFQYTINVNSLPEIIVADTTIYSDETLSVDLAANATSQYLRYNDQSISSSLEIDHSKLVAGENIITVVAENASGCTTEKALKVNFIESERPENRTLIVYPNPSSDFINIADLSAESLSNVSIYRTDGQMVGSYVFEGINKASIPVNHLDPGLYIITSELSGKIITSRFVKI